MLIIGIIATGSLLYSRLLNVHNRKKNFFFCIICRSTAAKEIVVTRQSCVFTNEEDEPKGQEIDSAICFQK